MTVETRERFLRAIAERIAPERIEELHLFPPIRQGGKESGVAVITVRPEAEVVEATEADALREATGASPDESAEPAADEGARSVAEDLSPDRPEPTGEPERAPAVPEGAESVDLGETTEDAEGGEASAIPVAGAEMLESLVADDASAGGSEPEAPPPPPRRLTVYRASYRHTLKGPDRGKWEVEVIEEALAPAYTVDEVVRGVHERAGGDAEPERLTGEGVRAAISEEPWTASR